jgi:hypothetical protein
MYIRIQAFGVIGERPQFRHFNTTSSVCRISSSVQAPSVEKEEFYLRKSQLSESRALLGPKTTVKLGICTQVLIFWLLT